MALYVGTVSQTFTAFTTRHLLSFKSHLLCRVNRVLRVPRLSETVSARLPQLIWKSKNLKDAFKVFKGIPPSYSPSDINECPGGSHRCVSSVNGGQCTNTVGSYTCSCVGGYSGNGIAQGQTVGGQAGTNCAGKWERSFGQDGAWVCYNREA